MLKNNIKIAWRNLWRNKRYAAINIFGLSIGISVTIILYQFISYHLSFDQYHPQSDRLYRVVTDLHLPDGSIEFDPGAPIVLGEQLKASLPEVENYALLLGKRSFTVSINAEGGFNNKLFIEDENVAFANPQWLELFSYAWKSGNPTNALSKPNTAVITKSLADKYFEDKDPVGEIIKLDNEHEVTITGVLENNPPNTDIRAEMFLSFASFKNFYPDIHAPMTSNWDWVSSSTSLFVLLSEKASLQQVDENLSNLARENLGDYLGNMYLYRFQPLAEVHFDKRYDGVIQKSMLTALGLVGLLLVVIVSVNFTNLATAQSARRSKEIGIRKVMGSSRSSIFLQNMTETAFITLLGFLVALVLVILFLPSLNNWLKISLSLDILGDVGLAFTLLTYIVLTIFCAGFYPAVVLSRLKPVSALKNQLDKAQTASTLRKFLIITQNIIAQLLIICTLIIAMQLNFLKTTDLGFDREMVVMVPVPDQVKGKMEYLRNQLMADPNIVTLCYCSRPPSSEGGGGTIKYNNGDWLDFAVRSRPADINYLETFGLELIAGRNVSQSDTVREFVINEQLLSKLDVRSPQEILGKTIIAGELSQNPGTIVGVVKDFHSSYLYAPKEPLLITTQLNLYKKVAVKINPGNTSEAINHIQEEWKAIYPNNVFEYNFLSDQLAQAYEIEDVISKLIWLSAIVAILLSSLGWLGLISLVTVQRAKEISIRKILGASSSKIRGMLSLDFLKLVGLATLIASPLAWYLMNRYLQEFTYRIDIQWWLFVLSAALSALIVLMTTSYKTFKASRANPIKTLTSN